MDNIFENLIKHRILVVLMGLVFVFIAAFGAKNLEFRSDYRVFFGADNPQLNAYEKMQQVYTKSDSAMFVVAPADGNVFSRETLSAVKELTEQSWQIPYSTRVDSLVNFQHTRAEEDDLIVDDLVPDSEVLLAEDLTRIKQIAISDPLLHKRLISTTGHVTAVNVTIRLPQEKMQEELPHVVKKVWDIRDAVASKYPHLTIYLTGIVMMNSAFAEASENDFANLMPKMFLAVMLMIGILLRTITGTINTIIIIFSSIFATMGLSGWFGLYLTGPSASAPIMILTLAVADCVHILATMYHEMRQGVGKRTALLDSLRINFKPIFLTSITTAIGFLSMNFSDAPPFRDLGNMVAGGVMLAFIFSITIFPALMMILPVKVKIRADGQGDIMDSFSDFVIAHQKSLLIGTLLVVVGFIYHLPNNELNDDFVKYFDKSVPFRQAADFTNDNLSGMAIIEFSVDSGEENGINSPAFIADVEKFTGWLRGQDEVVHVNTISDTLKRLNQNMHGDDPAYYKVPENRELAAQYLLMYEMSLPYGLDLNNQLNVKKSATRVIATMTNLTSNQNLEIEKRANDWVTENISSFSTRASSPTLMFSHIGQRNIVSMLIGATSALLLISILLIFALRSVKYGALSLLPNILPASVAFGLWGILYAEVGLALSVVASMSLGVVVDDTVHFLSKYLYARNERNYDAVQAIKYAFASVGRALWITTMVLVVGFMVLAQSTFKANADMGLLTAITIGVALAIDFLFLPPLLLLIDRMKGVA